MAKVAPVVAVSAGVLCPNAEQERNGRPGQEQHADGGGDDERQNAA